MGKGNFQPSTEMNPSTDNQKICHSCHKEGDKRPNHVDHPCSCEKLGAYQSVRLWNITKITFVYAPAVFYIYDYYKQKH